MKSKNGSEMRLHVVRLKIKIQFAKWPVRLDSHVNTISGIVNFVPSKCRNINGEPIAQHVPSSRGVYCLAKFSSASEVAYTNLAPTYCFLHFIWPVKVVECERDDVGCLHGIG
jgi:hypothetical protein